MTNKKSLRKIKSKPRQFRTFGNLFLMLTLLILYRCSSEEDIPIINESSQYAECNSKLLLCNLNENAEYCLLGFKWGASQNFNETGNDASGPKTPAGIITYAFQEKNGTINTHKQIDVPSESWNEILSCAQKHIRTAISAWEDAADISFQELTKNSESEIKFYVAAIIQSAVAYPNFPESPCDILTGNVIFDANSKEKSCKAFYVNALHEIGHVLGLGHVNSNNIMTESRVRFDYDELQSGDIEGIQQIYGVK